MNSIWKDLKTIIRVDDNKPLSMKQGSSTNKLSAVLTSNVQDPKIPVQDKNFTTGELFDNSPPNVLDPKAQYNLRRPTSVSQYVPTQSVFAKEDDINNSKSWNDLVMKGPCSYSMMEKPFDNVLFKHQKNTQQLLMKLKHDDWDLKLVHVGSIGAAQCCVKNNIVGNYNAFDSYKPYFKVGEENNFGVKSVINQYLLNDSGLRLNANQFGQAINSFYTNFQYAHPAVVLDTKFKYIQHYKPQKAELYLEVSGVIGHSFDSFGLLAGFNLAKSSSSQSEWAEICQSVSFALVLPTNAVRFTLQPNTDMCTISTYWKVNNILELGSQHKVNWRSRESTIKDHEIGVKCKYSESLTCGIKSNLVGNITTGAWYNAEFFKMGLFTSFNFRNQFEEVGTNMGISIEF